MSRRVMAAVVGALLTIQTGFLVYSAKIHSPTWDEVGHLAAGISHWELGRFELYSVNPPLVRTIAAAPVYLLDPPEMDWDFYRNDPSMRSEVFLGRRMIELNGERSWNQFFLARLAVIPIALLGSWLCFLWGRDLFGPKAGLFALALWAVSPNVLGYGWVFTPDLASGVAMLGCSYLFWRWMQAPGWAGAILLGLGTGLAMLTKSVWLALPLVYAVVWASFAVVAWRRRGDVADTEPTVAESPRPPTARTFTGNVAGWCRSVVSLFQSAARLPVSQLAAASLLALVMLNGFYGFRGTLQPLGELTFVSERLAGPAIEPEVDPNCTECGDPVPVVMPGNRYAESWLGAVPIPVPANFLQGVDVQLRDFERGRFDRGWMSFLNGTWRSGGWWYFYLVGLFYKVPLATWALIGLATVVAIVAYRQGDAVQRQGVWILWAPAVGLLLLLSSTTGVTRYIRYALPVLPVLLIWASQVMRPME
ncbi:MAG: glycosyltransferase family 39 protein, partial [Cyanobacteria bacterium P01_E01_bin.43]